MTVHDLDRVCELEVEIFSSPWSRRAFESELYADSYSRSFVVTQNRRVIAYLVYWHVSGEIHIANIAVDPKYRRRGIASWIMSKLLKSSESKGIKIVHLEVRESNLPAIALYRKMGFRLVGKREKYYQIENEDALLMSLELEQNSERP